MKIKTNGIEINCEIAGEGPWVTLSHSLACNLHMWDDQMAVLTKHYKVLRFDTRGHTTMSRSDDAATASVVGEVLCRCSASSSAGV